MSTPLAGRRILVTGAGGFIGRTVGRHLSLAGADVRGGVRRAKADGIRNVQCDLDNPGEVAKAIAGHDLVVHAAYGDVSAMLAQTRNLLSAMTDAGVSQLIHFSSIAVYGEAEGTVAESHPAAGRLDGYGQTKALVETEIRAWADALPRQRRVIILRPGIVYGANSPFWIEKLAQRIRLGAWGTFGPSGQGICAAVHVDDVAEIVCRAVATLSDLPEPVTVLNVVGPNPPSWNGYFEALARSMGDQQLPELSGALLYARQLIAAGAKAARKIRIPAPERWVLAPTPGEIALFARKALYDTDALYRILGTRPSIALDEGLRRSLPQVKT